MKYFDSFVSNTIAGGGSQTLFHTDGTPQTGRIFYRVTEGGEFNYSLLFSNIIDTTFSDGNISRKNRVVDSWDILGARLGVCPGLDFAAMTKTTSEPSVTMGELSGDPASHVQVFGFVELTFGGKKQKEVMPGEFFASDPVKLNVPSGGFLCFELTFCGRELPYHAESIIPAFVLDGESWQYSRQIPFPAMVGVDRKVNKRVCFIGDSITQGCGTAINSYTHWNAVLTQMLPRENAYWNLGYGYARAADLASNGSWLFKAKQNDYVVVCLGVNDIFHDFGPTAADRIISDLTEIVFQLKKAGLKVMVQTVPPFDYTGEYLHVWRKINAYIRTEMRQKADAVFDNVATLSTDGPDCPTARYVGHPNAEGCMEWAKALKPAMDEFLAL